MNLKNYLLTFNEAMNAPLFLELHIDGVLSLSCWVDDALQIFERTHDKRAQLKVQRNSTRLMPQPSRIILCIEIDTTPIKKAYVR